MHASCRHFRDAVRSTDEVAALGSRLAVRLSRLPGFVWFLVLDAGGGDLVSVSVFESATELAEADGLTAEWLTAEWLTAEWLTAEWASAAPAQEAHPSPLPAVPCRGEVLVQRGL